MNVNYLRVSVTDRCNLRCIYCNPLGGGARDRQEILTFQEISRVVGFFAACGIRTVRLTGGEPLVRTGIVDLVRELANIPGVDDLALTTNGVLLGPMAAELRGGSAPCQRESGCGGSRVLSSHDRLRFPVAGSHRYRRGH